MMDDKLRAELAFLLTASLRDQSVHVAIAERRAAFAPRLEGGGEMRGTLKYEWDRYGGVRDGLAFDRFLAEFGVLILCRRCRCQIDPYDVQPVVERGDDPRDLDWTCEGCRAD